jgi:hypothetical protein
MTVKLNLDSTNGMISLTLLREKMVFSTIHFRRQKISLSLNQLRHLQTKTLVMVMVIGSLSCLLNLVEVWSLVIKEKTSCKPLILKLERLKRRNFLMLHKLRIEGEDKI